MFSDLINVSVLIVHTNTYKHKLTQTSLIRLDLLALYITMHSRRIIDIRHSISMLPKSGTKLSTY